MWWHESDDGTRLICDLCPRHCALRPGDRGFCFVRENRDGKVVSTTYGRSTGFCIDPIEKKPLNQFYPGTAVLSFGTPGCNLGCTFCQNWTMSRSKNVEAACETGRAAGHRRGRQTTRLPQRGLHLQRSDHLGGIRHRHGPGVPRRRREDRGGHLRLHHGRGPGGVLSK